MIIAHGSSTLWLAPVNAHVFDDMYCLQWLKKTVKRQKHSSSTYCVPGVD